MANELKPLSNELYEHYPLMSAQTHEAHVKAYAKAHMKEGNTRPAAPVEGLVCETCNGTGNEGRGLICRDCDEPTPPTVLVRYTLDNRPNYDHDGNPYADPVMSPKINGEYVRFDQAEAIIAAKEQIIDRHREAQVILGKQLNEVIADNAALTARVKEVDDECNLWKETDASHLIHIKALETQLAAARNALQKIAGDTYDDSAEKIARAALEDKP